MRVTQFKALLEILIQQDLGDQYIESSHDVVFLPIHDQDVDFAEQLEAAGAFHSSEYDCWCVFT